MTSVSTASPSVICQEVFDDGYQPSAEEINEYAIKIGIDPGKEPYLLYLARDGLLQALPTDWKICYNDEIQAHYYYNVQTKASQWDHPLDTVYRALVDQARQKHAPNIPLVTNSVIDVSDDASQLDSGIRSLQGNEESELNMQDTTSPLVNFKANMNRFLEGREKKLLNHDPIKNSRFEVVKTSPQIGLDMRFNPDSATGFHVNRKNSDDHDNEKRLSGFAISGTGSMFLKSNVKRDAQSNFVDWSKDTNRGKNLFVESLGPSVKGILRDSSLTDVRRKFDDTENEDKKSVRFNLDDIKKDNFSPEEDPSSSRKFGPSPEVSENSDDDDPWDFMEDQAEEEEEEKHVKEVKVVPVNKNPPVQVFKPILKPHISSDEILNKPQNKLLAVGRTFSADIIGEKSSSLIIEKMKERNLVKPLYEDTDSDSKGSSIRSFILKTSGEDLDSLDYKNDDLENLRKEHELQIMELKERFQEERDAEENKLRIEMLQNLERRKEELILENGKNLNALKEDFKNESLNELSEETITRKRQEIDNQISKNIELYRAEKEVQKKQRIQTEKEKFEKLLHAEIEELKREYNQKILDVQHEYNVKLDVAKKDLEIEQSLKVDEYRLSLQDEFDVTRKTILEEHKVTVDTLQQNHTEILQELERDLKSEEEIVKKEHAAKVIDMKDKLAHEMELEKQRMRECGEDRLYEKMRCEKRLLEDKYRCLKEKYIRLKTDVKLSLERRNRRREQQVTQQQSLNTTTGSETERSTSNKPSIGNSENRSATVSSPYADLSRPPANPKGQVGVKEHIREKSSDRNQSKDRKLGIASKYIKQLQSHYQDDATSISQSDTTISNNYPRGRYLPAPFSDNGNSDSEAFKRNQENNNNPRERQRKKLFSRMKSASTSRLNTENFKVDRPCTPVESLRRQLQKLEDLEDQFPDNTLDTTYHLRYPFSDISNDRAGASSELEFFKHRIHLERDSVRRAKESLRTQRTNFRARQREIKQRHKISSTRHTLDHLIQEERELTEMEVNLHRTRALLGEKVIRLRHLEESLQRIYEKEKPVDFLLIENKDDATLSDLSSHSSSGFSSTDFASDTNPANVHRRKEMYQESSECIQNLEILNAEIREILDILSRQQTHGLAPPSQIGNPDLNWALLAPSAPPANTPTPLLHAPQSIPTLADRLETYRQLAAGRMHTSMSGAVMAANTIVSQNPRAVNYTTSLVERTRDLRNWLRQAKNEHDILTSGNLGANIENGTGQQANL